MPAMQAVLKPAGSHLAFEGGKTNYLTHGIHPFAARFPPQLPNHFIKTLSEPGDVVLDPMVGSGTTILEASLLGRVGVGVDFDPLATLISHVKSCPADASLVENAANRIVRDNSPILAGHFPFTNERLGLENYLSRYDED